MPPWARWTLLAIIAVGALFPLYRLDQRGILFVDEGCYLVESHLMLSGAKLPAHQLEWYPAEEPSQLLDYISLPTFSHVSAKPVCAACKALGLWLFGNSIRSVLPVSAIFGILRISFLLFFPDRLLQNAHASSVCSLVFVRGVC